MKHDLERETSIETSPKFQPKFQSRSFSCQTSIPKKESYFFPGAFFGKRGRQKVTTHVRIERDEESLSGRCHGWAAKGQVSASEVRTRGKSELMPIEERATRKLCARTGCDTGARWMTARSRLMNDSLRKAGLNPIGEIDTMASRAGLPESRVRREVLPMSAARRQQLRA